MQKCVVITSYRPALVEAKRAFLWTTKLNGTVERVSKQTPAIQKDIEKLVTYEKQFNNPEEAPRGYLLVWNITDTDAGTNIGPFEYANELSEDCEHFTIWQVRAAPLSVKLPLTEGAKLEDFEVDNWLWLVLAEVTYQEPGSLKKPG